MPPIEAWLLVGGFLGAWVGMIWLFVWAVFHYQLSDDIEWRRFVREAERNKWYDYSD